MKFLNLYALIVVVFFLGACSQLQLSNSATTSLEEVPTEQDEDKDNNDESLNFDKSAQSDDLLSVCAKVCSKECQKVVEHFKARILLIEQVCGSESQRDSDQKVASQLMADLQKYPQASNLEDRLEISTRISLMTKSKERSQAFIKILEFGQRYDDLIRERKYLLRLAWRMALQNEPLRAARCYISQYDAVSRGKVKTRDDKNTLAEQSCPILSVEDFIP
jgi:hypothetical protein